MAKRLAEFEVENTKLLRDDQGLLEQVNAITDQMHGDRDALVHAIK